MSPIDLIRSRDGSMSLTKLAATTGHFLAAVMFVRLQWNAEFNGELWLSYMGIAVLHASYDKTIAAVSSFKNRQLGQEQ